MSAAGCSRLLVSGPGFSSSITSERIAPTSANAAGWRSVSQEFEAGPSGLGDAPNIRTLSGFLHPASTHFTQQGRGAADGDSWSCRVPSLRSD